MSMEIFNSVHSRSDVKEAASLSLIEDSEEEPFLSKYKARTILEKILTEFQEEYDKHSSDEFHESFSFRLSIAEILLGLNFANTEELASGEKLLMHGVGRISNKGSQDLGYALTLIEAYNALGLLWSQRSNYQTAKDFLLQSIALYDGCLSSKEARAEPEESSKVELSSALENLHTHSLFYVAQACQHLGEIELAAQYCQLTMNRQIQSNAYDPSECAKNCVFLSSFYVNLPDLTQADHFLTAAEFLLAKCPGHVIPSLRADVNRARGVFYLKFLKLSVAEHVDHEARDAPQEAADAAHDQDHDRDRDARLQRVFHLALPLPPPSSFALVRCFDQARGSFLSAQSHFLQALEFYVLDGYVTDHIGLLQQYSAAFKYLAVFEGDVDRKIKMLKKRAGLLESLVPQLNANVYLDLCRQLTHELGEIYADTGDLRWTLLTPRSTLAVVAKWKETITAAVRFLRKFVALMEKDGKILQEDVENIRSYVFARMRIAQLYGKQFQADRESTVLSLKEYQEVRAFLDVCKLPDFEQETSIISEMCQLLPQKIEKLTI